MIGKREKFHGIEAGRAIAAILVVFHHAGNNIAEKRFYDTRILGGHLGNFNVGVDFFFVLSGFIIAWIHWKDIGYPSRLGHYARRRFVRIYPPYWAILLPLAALYLLTPGAGKVSQHDPVVLLFSFLLLPYTSPPIIGAAWTLVHEVMFYAIFGLAIALGRRGLWLLPVWAVAILGAQAFPQLAFPWSTLLSSFNIEFLIGIAVALALRRFVIPQPALFAWCGIGIFAILLLFATSIQDVSIVARLAFGFSAAFTILGLVELERSRGLAIPRWLQFLGGASYAIYLIHGFVLSMTIQVSVHVLPRSIPLTVILLLLCTIAVSVGCVFHILIERPLTRRLNRAFARADTTDVLGTSGSVVEVPPASVDTNRRKVAPVSSGRAA